MIPERDKEPVSLPEFTPSRPAKAPVFSPGHVGLYALAVILLTGLFIGGMLYFRKWVDVYQYQRDRYAAERAMDALLKGKDKEAVRLEVERLLADVPIRRDIFNRNVNEIWEGSVLRNRITIMKQLAVKLLQADMAAESEAVSLKSILEYHVFSRTLELIDLWELLYNITGFRQNWVSAYEISNILAAHGVDRLRTPDMMDPVPFKDLDPKLFMELQANMPPGIIQGLKEFYASTTPRDYQEADETLRKARSATPNPAIRNELTNTIHRCLTDGGQREAARKLFGEAWGRDPSIMDTFWRDAPKRQYSMNLLDRDPTLLEMMWRDRPATSTLTITSFLESFYGDSRLHVVDMRKLQNKKIGYFNLKNSVIPSGDWEVLHQSVAATMQVQTAQPIHRICLAYQSELALGICPILLMRVNNEPYIPIYCNSLTPSFATIDYYLAPGTYDFEFVFLNDTVFTFARTNIEENRNLYLIRMALIHVPPSESP